jgi:hypothetical protein
MKSHSNYDIELCQVQCEECRHVVANFSLPEKLPKKITLKCGECGSKNISVFMDFYEFGNHIDRSELENAWINFQNRKNGWDMPDFPASDPEPRGPATADDFYTDD